MKELLAKLIEWREAEQEASDIRMALEMYPTTTEEMRKKWQHALYVAHGKMVRLFKALDAYLAAHPDALSLAARYDEITKSEWFRKAYEGRSLGEQIVMDEADNPPSVEEILAVKPTRRKGFTPPAAPLAGEREETHDAKS